MGRSPRARGGRELRGSRGPLRTDAARCGDGFCSGEEDIERCSIDCGAVQSPEPNPSLGDTVERDELGAGGAIATAQDNGPAGAKSTGDSAIADRATASCAHVPPSRSPGWQLAALAWLIGLGRRRRHAASQKPHLGAPHHRGGHIRVRLEQSPSPRRDLGSNVDKENLHVDHSPTSPHRDNIYLTWHENNVMKFARSTNRGSTWSSVATVSGVLKR